MKNTFLVKGMHCNSCARRIEDALKDKVNKISVNYSKEQVEIDFDKEKISEKEIFEVVSNLGYEFIEQREKKNKEVYYLIGFVSLIGVLVAYIFLSKFGLNLDFFSFDFNFLNQNTSLVLLFVAGLLTGFHCIAMCGGFLVSYITKNALNGHKSFLQHLVYGSGKVISYTLVGALFGLIGSFFVFSPSLRGGIAIFAGIFMVAYSLSMFGFGFFRKFQFNPKFLTKVVNKKYSGVYFGPAMTGLLNGLFLACGPLQAMYLYAAGTGSAVQGGISLMVFGIGTLPVMLGFGGFANLISRNATKKILKISAVIVLILGLIMFNRGLALTGAGYDIKSVLGGVKNVGTLNENFVLDSEGYQVIEMEVNRYGWQPDNFVLKKDIPVRWVIEGKEINGCNKAIQVPKLGLEFNIKKGKQIIEFTPTEEGVISWSCWMGMIPGTFIVTDSGTATETQIEEINKQSSTGGSCGEGASCGGGCGGGCGSGGCGI